VLEEWGEWQAPESHSIARILIASCFSINLVAASMVIIFDQDFNREYQPYSRVAGRRDAKSSISFCVLAHNDKQAMDRAYRIVSFFRVVVVKGEQR
jgi:SNF2 family DNA or RNA helicase